MKSVDLDLFSPSLRLLLKSAVASLMYGRSPMPARQFLSGSSNLNSDCRHTKVHIPSSSKDLRISLVSASSSVAGNAPAST